MKQPAVYILASQRNGTLYVGVTSDLVQRIWTYKNHLAEGFTHRYNVDQLVFYELHTDMQAAITREKQIKKWNRAWKIALIEKHNPEWRDLWAEIVGELSSSAGLSLRHWISVCAGMTKRDAKGLTEWGAKGVTGLGGLAGAGRG